MNFINNEDFFSIGAFFCEKITQADSCNFNTVLFYCGTNWQRLDSIFAIADAADIKVILATAAQPFDAQSHNIQRFSGGQHLIWEAESTCSTNNTGKLITDHSASGGKAWVISSNEMDWLLIGPENEDHFIYWAETLSYYVYFWLKTNNIGRIGSICKICVRMEDVTDTNIIAQRVLNGRDFSRKDVYEKFILSFKKTKYDTRKIDYGIWYMGTNDSIYIDKVEIRDAVADSLKNEYYDKSIAAIARYHNKKNSMFRYYMFDEPDPDQYYASGEVNYQLRNINAHIGGIQQIYQPGVLNSYLDTVDPDELFIDKYPFLGKERPEGRTPIDSGSLFQERIDDMCKLFSEARHAIKLHPGKKLWISSPTFGNPRTDNQWNWKKIWKDSIPFNDEGRWREPTLRELRCLIWLGLAYGAKGINHFLYTSEKEPYFNPITGQQQYYWVCGLTTPDNYGSEKRQLWFTVKTINKELECIGSRLVSLVSDTVFKGSDGVPSKCFIKSIRISGLPDTLIQIGTFHHKGNTNERYFIVVNRHCLPSESLDVVIGIEDKPSYLYDCSTNEKINRISVPGCPQALLFYRVKLQPGQGRFFQIRR